jgi:hypothetical protein
MKEDRMQSLIKASFLLLVLSFVSANAFAFTMECTVQKGMISGVKSIHLSEENLSINGEMEIPLEKTQINCGHFKKQVRLAGRALGYQIILKSCTSDAVLEGDLIDSVRGDIAQVSCE